MFVLDYKGLVTEIDLNTGDVIKTIRPPKSSRKIFMHNNELFFLAHRFDRGKKNFKYALFRDLGGKLLFEFNDETRIIVEELNKSVPSMVIAPYPNRNIALSNNEETVILFTRKNIFYRLMNNELKTVKFRFDFTEKKKLTSDDKKEFFKQLEINNRTKYSIEVKNGAPLPEYEENFISAFLLENLIVLINRYYFIFVDMDGNFVNKIPLPKTSFVAGSYWDNLMLEFFLGGSGDKFFYYNEENDLLYQYQNSVKK